MIKFLSWKTIGVLGLANLALVSVIAPAALSPPPRLVYTTSEALNGRTCLVDSGTVRDPMPSQAAVDQALARCLQAAS